MPPARRLLPAACPIGRAVNRYTPAKSAPLRDTASGSQPEMAPEEIHFVGPCVFTAGIKRQGLLDSQSENGQKKMPARWTSSTRFAKVCAWNRQAAVRRKDLRPISGGSASRSANRYNAHEGI